MPNRFVERGGWWVLAQSALLLVVAGLDLGCHSESKHLSLNLGGLFLLLVSAFCALAGVVALGRNLTPFPKPLAKAQLVQRGIYRWLRHPLYTAVMCGAAGWSLLRQSWPALVVSLGLVVFLDAKARREERWLRQQFPEYADYARRVRRFVPWVY